MTTPDFANDDVSGAFQRNGVPQVSEPVIIDETEVLTIQMKKEWIEFMKDLWD
jgi:hypothetical protein